MRSARGLTWRVEFRGQEVARHVQADTSDTGETKELHVSASDEEGRSRE